jgi:hypothetical protein
MPKVLTHKLRVQYRGEVFKYVVAHYGHGKLWATKREAHEEFQKKARKIIDDRLGPVKRA